MAPLKKNGKPSAFARASASEVLPLPAGPAIQTWPHATSVCSTSSNCRCCTPKLDAVRSGSLISTGRGTAKKAHFGEHFTRERLYLRLIDARADAPLQRAGDCISQRVAVSGRFPRRFRRVV